jgi:predicted SprT family Zn-dependent metalloprotease
MISRSKKNFAKSFFYGSDVKRFVKKLRVIVRFNKRLRSIAGQAYVISYKDLLKLIKKVDKRIRYYCIETSKDYLIIELNKKLLTKKSKKFLFDTVSHELAHCVDFILRGYVKNTKRKQFHDYYWKAIHISMGGDGAATY